MKKLYIFFSVWHIYSLQGMELHLPNRYILKLANQKSLTIHTANIKFYGTLLDIVKSSNKNDGNVIKMSEVSLEAFTILENLSAQLQGQSVISKFFSSTNKLDKIAPLLLASTLQTAYFLDASWAFRPLSQTLYAKLINPVYKNEFSRTIDQMNNWPEILQRIFGVCLGLRSFLQQEAFQLQPIKKVFLTNVTKKTKLAISDNGNFLAISIAKPCKKMLITSKNNNLEIYSISSNEILYTIHYHANISHPPLFNAQGNCVAVATLRRSVYLDPQKSHIGNQYLSTLVEIRKIYIHDIPGKKVLHKLKLNEPIQTMTFNAKGSQLAVTTQNGYLYLYEMAQGITSLKKKLSTHPKTNWATTLAFSKSGDKLYFSNKNIIECFDLRNHQVSNTNYIKANGKISSIGLKNKLIIQYKNDCTIISAPDFKHTFAPKVEPGVKQKLEQSPLLSINGNYLLIKLSEKSTNNQTYFCIIIDFSRMNQTRELYSLLNPAQLVAIGSKLAYPSTDFASHLNLYWQTVPQEIQALCNK